MCQKLVFPSKTPICIFKVSDFKLIAGALKWPQQTKSKNYRYLLWKKMALVYEGELLKINILKICILGLWVLMNSG